MIAGPDSRSVLDRPIRDIMQDEVTTVVPQMSVRELTRVLSDEGISGAPVVTGDGRLIGVVSTSDITRTAASEPGAMVSFVSSARARPPVAGRPSDPDDDDDDEDGFYGDFFLPEEASVPVWGHGAGDDPFADLTVEDIMTDMAFTVEPTLTVRELANFLLRGRIHRAVVTESRSLVGIVTTMDILRAVAGDS